MSDKEPKVGESFWDSNEEDHEIEEICGADDDGTFDVAAEGDDWAIKWNDATNRWEVDD